MNLDQETYKAAREVAKEVLDDFNPTLFKEVLQGSPLIRGFKADVSFEPLKVVIKSVSLNDLPKRTVTLRDIEKFNEHILHSPLSVISMICIDFDYDFKVFKSNYQAYGEHLKFNFTLPDKCGNIIAIKCIDILGNEIIRTYNKEIN